MTMNSGRKLWSSADALLKHWKISTLTGTHERCTTPSCGPCDSALAPVERSRGSQTPHNHTYLSFDVANAFGSIEHDAIYTRLPQKAPQIHLCLLCDWHPGQGAADGGRGEEGMERRRRN